MLLLRDLTNIFSHEHDKREGHNSTSSMVMGGVGSLVGGALRTDCKLTGGSSCDLLDGGVASEVGELPLSW